MWRGPQHPTSPGFITLASSLCKPACLTQSFGKDKHLKTCTDCDDLPTPQEDSQTFPRNPWNKAFGFALQVLTGRAWGGHEPALPEPTGMADGLRGAGAGARRCSCVFRLQSADLHLAGVRARMIHARTGRWERPHYFPLNHSALSPEHASAATCAREAQRARWERAGPTLPRLEE